MAFQNVGKPEGGRPELLEYDPTAGERIAGYLEDGLYLREAVILAGVSKSVFYKIYKIGLGHKKAGQETPESAFVDTIQMAMAMAEREALSDIRNAGRMPQFWAARAWFLERRYPEKYGRKDRLAMEHSGQMANVNVEATESLVERLATDEQKTAAKTLAATMAILGNPGSRSERGANGVGNSGNELEDEVAGPFELPEWGTD